MIKKANLSGADVEKLARSMGDELIVFPKEMIKAEEADPLNPGIIIIGNFLPDGSIGEKRKRGAYWH